jgi:hypothetical protein
MTVRVHQPYAPAALSDREDSWYSLVRRRVDPEVIVRLGLGQFENWITSSGIGPATLFHLKWTMSIAEVSWEHTFSSPFYWDLPYRGTTVLLCHKQTISFIGHSKMLSLKIVGKSDMNSDVVRKWKGLRCSFQCIHVERLRKPRRNLRIAGNPADIWNRIIFRLVGQSAPASRTG